jgi:hypothetical protein
MAPAVVLFFIELTKERRYGTMTHDYGCTGCMARHRHQEFILFLKRMEGEALVGLSPH